MSHPKDNLRGIALMIAAMAGFAVEDAFIKLAAASLPTGQILLMLGVAGGLVFGVMARRAGARVFDAKALNGAVIGRNLGEMIGTFGFVLALTTAPLSTVTAVQQAMPLAVTMGAALFLHETVGWRRWLAILAGFGGVMMIIRPGLEGFDPNALWAILAVFGLGGRDLFTRRVPQDISTMQLSALGFLSVGLLGGGMLAVSGGAAVPTGMQAAFIGGAVCVGIFAYFALTQANRIGEMSVITPFRYSRLIFGVALGVLVFAERPDPMTLAGGAVIIASGLYMFARERRRRALSNLAEAR